MDRQSEEVVRTDPASGADKNAVTEEGNVSRIRDILFGDQMLDYDQKFNRLEERFMQETASLSECIKAEQSARSDLKKEFSGELRQAVKALEKRQTELNDLVITTASDLRQQILDQSKMLLDEIANKYAETGNALNQTADELKEDKVDRSTLSALLAELSLRISDEPLPLQDKENQST